jgi:transcriptional regulator with XRE-family HTH domain
MRQLLLEKRLQKGLTQVELAKKAGVSYQVIYSVEKSGFPQPRNIPKLAEAYGLTPAEFTTILFDGK